MEKRLQTLIEPVLEDLGYALVRVLLTGNRRQTLQVMAERADGAEMTVDDCAEISRNLSAVLDVEDPIKGRYDLEVSSPGIDRPLTRRADFDRFAGFDARIELSRLVDGRKRFTGRLLGRDGEDGIRLATAESGDIVLPLDAVDKAKLILTDELIAASLKRKA